MLNYNTKQRNLLVSFFEKNPDKHFTIEEISNEIDNISISAIYRNISQMISDGVVQRFPKEGSRKYLYQYKGSENCSKHLHLKCDKCGVILHMNEETMNTVASAVEKNIGFDLNKEKTILLGNCSTCQQKHRRNNY